MTLRNIRQNHWTIHRLFREKPDGTFLIDGAGHSAPSVRPHAIRINNNIKPLTIEDQQDQIWGLKSGGITHWKFSCEGQRDFGWGPETEISLLSENGEFLPHIWHRDINCYNPLPPVDNINRVGGKQATQKTHIDNGRKDFYQYQALIQQYLGRQSDYRLLDWGIGCGRVARHFLPYKTIQVSGLDIDAMNIDWLNQHIPAIEAQHCDVSPPTSVEEKSVDVVISFSVLSHLSPENWQIWLQELKRLLKPSGIALLSFHGDHSTRVFLKEESPGFEKIQHDGFLDIGQNTDIGADKTDYYRNILYTDEHAREIFSVCFEVCDILPALVSGFQSIAVLRNR